jgi:hypothetical protein
VVIVRAVVDCDDLEVTNRLHEERERRALRISAAELKTGMMRLT